MAKRRQLPTLEQIESQLGYKIDYLDNVDEDVLTFYSDLTPVPKSSYERALRELDEIRKQKVQEAISSHELPLRGAPKIVSVHGDTVVAECSQQFGLYRFIVRISHENGLRLPLRLTEHETSRFIAVTKFQVENAHELSSVFFRLPRELRDRVYMFCIPDCEWKIADVDTFNSTTFVEAIGDPTGFYFPLHNHLSVLLISKQIRQEALSIAYRRTFFCLDDIDDFIKVAISIGQIGRANIEAVQFSWESRSDLYHGTNEYSEPEENQSQLPALHVSKCVQLLRECRRLAFLRIYFERHVLSNMSFANFQANTGIRELSSIRGIHRVKIESDICESRDHSELLKWLKKKMESSGD